MSYNDRKYVRSSKYKHVTEYINRISKKTTYKATINKNGRSNSKDFDNERDAAIFVDKQLLINGREPVNILVKKQT